MSKTLCGFVVLVLLGVGVIGGVMLFQESSVVRPGWQKVTFYVTGEQGKALEAYTVTLKKSVIAFCAEKGVEVKKTSTNRLEYSWDEHPPRGTKLHVWIFIPLQEGVKQSTQAEEYHGLLVERFNGQWSGKICCRHTDMRVYEDSKFLYTNQYFYMASSPEEEEELRKNGFLNLAISFSKIPAD